MPSQDAHLRSLGEWKVMQKPHRRPSWRELSFHPWATYSVRFILAGDLRSEWDTFGGLAAQLARFGTSMNLTVDGADTIEQTYDTRLRACADELSKFRQKKRGITKLLSEGDRRIKREVIRDCNISITFAPRRHPHANIFPKGDKTAYEKPTQWPGGNKSNARRAPAEEQTCGKTLERCWGDWGRNGWGKNNDWIEGASTRQEGAEHTEQKEDKAEFGKRKTKAG